MTDSYEDVNRIRCDNDLRCDRQFKLGLLLSFESAIGVRVLACFYDSKMTVASWKKQIPLLLISCYRNIPRANYYDEGCLKAKMKRRCVVMFQSR